MTDHRKLPKSIHTITALVNLSRFIMATGTPNPTTEEALDRAIQILKLDQLHDGHDVRAAALKQLLK